MIKTENKMARWEYLIIDDMKDGSPDSCEELNNLGNDGWELVGMKIEPLGNIKWYFKKEINLYDCSLRKTT